MEKLPKTFQILFLVIVLVYVFSNSGNGSQFNYYVQLANSFLQGHLYVDHPSVILDELVFWRGHYYVVYPPMPAILLMPFVAALGATLCHFFC